MRGASGVKALEIRDATPGTPTVQGGARDGPATPGDGPRAKSDWCRRRPRPCGSSSASGPTSWAAPGPGSGWRSSRRPATSTGSTPTASTSTSPSRRWRPFAWLYRKYFRVTLHGIEHVPADRPRPALRQPLRPAPLRRLHDRDGAAHRHGPAAHRPRAGGALGPHPPLRRPLLRAARAGGGDAGELPAAAGGRRGAAGLPGGGPRPQQDLRRPVQAADLLPPASCAWRSRPDAPIVPIGVVGAEEQAPAAGGPEAAGAAARPAGPPHHALRCCRCRCRSTTTSTSASRSASPARPTTRTPSWSGRPARCRPPCRRCSTGGWPSGPGSSCDRHRLATRVPRHPVLRHRHRRQPGRALAKQLHLETARDRRRPPPVPRQAQGRRAPPARPAQGARGRRSSATAGRRRSSTSASCTTRACPSPRPTASTWSGRRRSSTCACATA